MSGWDYGVGEQDAPPPPAGRLAGRYALGEALGGGAYGQAFLAHDAITGEQVVVKLLRAAGADLRREAVALRALGVDGIVRLLDQGVAADGRPFLVLAYAEGEDFPGELLTLPWDRLAPRAGDLLRILGRLHLHGALHLDLKPDNVRVREPDGCVMLIDLGLAAGPALGAAAGPIGGNLAFRDPALARGAAPSEGSDLQAAGRMIQAALAAPPPPAVAAALARLCHPDPVERFPDAWAALAALGLDAPEAPPIPAAGVAAACAPDSRLDQRPAWLQADLARAHGDDVAAQQADLTRRLRLGDLALAADGRLRVLRVRATDASPARPALEAHVDQALDRGEAAHALGLVRAALLHASPAGEERLVRRGLHAALDLRQAAALDEACYWLERARRPDAALLALARLATQVYSTGGHRDDLARLRALRGRSLTPFRPWIAGLHIQLLRSDGPDAQLAALEDLRGRWASTPELDARLLDCEGLILYHRGDYAEAAGRHEAAARQAPGLHRQLSALGNAAASWMELGELGRTVAHAAEMQRLAGSARHVFYFSRGEWLSREARWRRGDALVPDEAVVAGLAAQGVRDVAGLLAMTEACGARRLDEPDQARRLAARALALLPTTAQYGASRAIADALARGLDPAGDVDALVAGAQALGVADLTWQIVGLAACHPRGGPHRDVARALAAAAPDPDRQRELFAPADVLARLSR
ncbi:MAG: hypothetical protein H6706_11920 [Myxococcales bacterium]|nr:hypothetical protein [Myxococcales bacterium]